jgi:hypothetical protein
MAQPVGPENSHPTCATRRPRPRSAATTKLTKALFAGSDIHAKRFTHTPITAPAAEHTRWCRASEIA